MIFNHVFCPPSIFPDKNGKKSLGKFISSPTKENGNILLSYSDGDVCGDKKRIKTDIILVCKPGNSLKKKKDKMHLWLLPGDEAEGVRPSSSASRTLSGGQLDLIPDPLPRASPEMEKRCGI